MEHSSNFDQLNPSKMSEIIWSGSQLINPKLEGAFFPSIPFIFTCVVLKKEIISKLIVY